jgi:hypothetical protein
MPLKIKIESDDGKRKKNKITEDEIALLKNQILDEAKKHPPTVGLIGVSGVGKSTTINSLFGTSLKISHTVACTKEFTEINLELNLKNSINSNIPVYLRVFDAPGLGEDISRDPYYLEKYYEVLPECDVILWISAARNRAIALEQRYLLQLEEYLDKMVFAINQVDFVDPVDWNLNINLPSKEQKEYIEQICNDKSKKFSDTINKKIKMVPYSAKKKYNLEELFGIIIDTCEEKRRWLISGLKGFNYWDFIPKEIKDKYIKDDFKLGR